MSSGQGLFESDKEYSARIANQANERTISESSGSSPKQGWVESDAAYSARISREASESRIKDSTGSSPSQGWFESKDGYSQRVHREANERVVKDSTGSAPSRGWAESESAYDTRIRKEANEQTLKAASGSTPSQGIFEGDHEYRSRLAREAHQARASGFNRKSAADAKGNASSSNAGPIGQPGKSGGGGWMFLAIGVLFVSWLMSNRASETDSPPKRSDAEIAEEQRRRAEEMRLHREATLAKFNFSLWKVGQTVELSSNPTSFCTRLCSGGASTPITIWLASITKQSNETMSLNFSVRTAKKQQHMPGGFEIREKSDFLLFVKDDSYTELGYGTRASKSLYAEAMHLSDGRGNKYKALSGIEGLNTEVFNRHALSALLPFDAESHFSVLFPIPAAGISSLSFVSPSLYGHQNTWGAWIF